MEDSCKFHPGFLSSASSLSSLDFSDILIAHLHHNDDDNDNDDDDDDDEGGGDDDVDDDDDDEVDFSTSQLLPPCAALCRIKS